MNHVGTRILETARLTLRPFQMEDAPEMYANWASDETVTKYLTWPTHPNAGLTAQLLTLWTGEYAQPNAYNWAMELRETGEVIGNISCVRMAEDVGEIEIGYCMGQKWWHQGFMSEAAARTIRFFFEEVGARRICAKHDPRNPHSGGVMRKCGMQFEGTLRQAFRNNQGICDVSVYSILLSEYERKS